MLLLISIIAFPENCTVDESSKTFGEHGGSIGRSAENFWVLSDPDCYLSSRHSEVTFENGHYILTDLSTNGTFLNGSREPMGNGNKVQLQDGDEIELSDYKFSIKFLSEPDNHHINDDPFTNNMVPNETLPKSGFMSSDPFATGEIAPVESLLNSIPQIVDPLTALDSIQSNNNKVFSSDVFSATVQPEAIESHSDQSDILGQSVIWPRSHIDESVIPEDWDLSDSDDVAVLDEPIVAVSNNTMVDANTIQRLRAENACLGKKLISNKLLKNKNISLQNELKKIKQQFLAYQKNNKTTQFDSVDTTMITAMGLSTKNLSKQQIIAVNRVVGEMVRETVIGMMQVLTSRNSIKNEFRMNVTTIQPVENNPLKFSANVDDALENMFLKSGSSYKKPIEAITDGFHGIAEHQIAILAGIRSAFKMVVERFEPDKLEKRFDRQKKGIFDFLPLFKNSKNWHNYVNYFKDLSDDMDDSFQYLFGDEFVQAYEEQLQKLLVARNSKKVN